MTRTETKGAAAAHPSGVVSTFNDWARLALQVPTLVLLLITTVIIVLTVIDAQGDRSIVIEPLSVPTDFPARGLSGAVLSAQLAAKLAELQRQTQSERPPEPLEVDFNQPVKVEVPGSGLDLSEIIRLLHERIGHRTVVSADIFRLGHDIVLESRVGDRPVAPVSGQDDAVESLVQTLAEHIFFATAPYRYAEYLDEKGCHLQARTLTSQIATRGQNADRAWAYALWSNILVEDGDFAGARIEALNAVARDRSLAFARQDLAEIDTVQGHTQPALQNTDESARLLDRALRRGAPAFVTGELAITRAAAARMRGAYLEAAGHYRDAEVAVTPGEDVVALDLPMSSDLAFGHDPTAAAEVLRGVPARTPSRLIWFMKWHEPFTPPDLAAAIEAEAWDRVAERVAVYEKELAGEGFLAPPRNFYTTYDEVWLRAWGALADAHLAAGQPARAAAARAWLAGPYDPACEFCRRLRGRVFAALGDVPSAEAEFAAAIAMAPNLAFAPFARAQMHAAQGQTANALRDLAIAGRLAPHWADPLLLAAELRAQRGETGDALAAAEAAASAAPSWSRPAALRARLLSRLGRDGEAAAAATSARSLQRQEAEGLNALIALVGTNTTTEPIAGDAATSNPLCAAAAAMIDPA